MFPYPHELGGDDWPARVVCPDCRMMLWFYRARVPSGDGGSRFEVRIAFRLHLRQC